MIINFIIKLINRPPHLLRRWNYNDSYVFLLCVCVYVYICLSFTHLLFCPFSCKYKNAMTSPTSFFYYFKTIRNIPKMRRWVYNATLAFFFSMLLCLFFAFHSSLILVLQFNIFIRSLCLARRVVKKIKLQHILKSAGFMLFFMF